MEQRPPQASLASIVTQLLAAPATGGPAVRQPQSLEKRPNNQTPSARPPEADLVRVRASDSRTTKQGMFHPSYDMALRSGWRPPGSG